MPSNTIKAQIVESKHITDLNKHISNNTWLLLDLDNTTMGPLLDLGGDGWFEKLMSYACQLMVDTQEAAALVITIYHAVQHHIKTKAVEPEIVDIIRTLQERGVPIIGITARGNELIDTTVRQLGEIGIDFSVNRAENENHIPLANTGAIYHQGIIYCSGGNKGKAFDAFLDRCQQLPANVAMADDKEKHLKTVLDTVVKRGIHFDGLRYGFMDKVAHETNLKTANEQLAHLLKDLPASAQKAIERLKLIPADVKVDEKKYAAYFVDESKLSKHPAVLFAKKTPAVAPTLKLDTPKPTAAVKL